MKKACLALLLALLLCLGVFVACEQAPTENESPSTEEIRTYCQGQIDQLWEEVRRFENPHVYYVDLSQKLWDLKQNMLLGK